MPDQTMPNVFIPQFQNPLALAQQGADLQSALYRNQLFKSKQAAGQAFQGSIGPDGLPNQNKLLQGLAGNPNAAMSAQESAQAGQNLQNTSQGRGQQAQTAVNQGIASLLTLPEDQLNGQVIKQKIAALTQAGAITPQDAQAAESDLPPDGSPAASYKQYALRHLVSNLAGPQQVQTIFGTQGTVDTGAATVPVNRASAPMGGAMTVQPGAVPNEGMQPQYIVDPNSPPGAPRYLQVNTPRNVAAPSQYAAPNMGSGGYRPPGAAPGAVPAGAAPQAGGGAAPPVAPTAPAGSTLAAPPQNLPEANVADQNKFVQDQAGLPAVRQNMVNLAHANDALKLISSTGPGTEGAHQLYSFLNAQGVLPKDMADNSTNYDLFRKYAEKYVIDSSGGQNTDAGRAMTAASNAGTGIGTAANQEVLRNEIARQRNSVVQVLSAPDQRTGSGYLSHSANFGGKIDQRGLVTDLYTPEQNAAYRKSLKGPALDRYLRAMGMAAAFKLNGSQGAAPTGGGMQ